MWFRLVSVLILPAAIYLYFFRQQSPPIKEMTTPITQVIASLPPNLQALCVGGTAGIGEAVAKLLSNSLPASKIYIAGRNATAADKIVGSASNKNMEFLPLKDGMLISEVRNSMDAFEKRLGENGKLDLLVITQGMLTMQGRTETKEGLDQKMALHYYSRMEIIRTLINKGLLKDDATIVSILDGKNGDLHGSKILWEDMDLRKPGNYGIAKTALHCLTFTDIMVQDFATTQSPPAARTFIHAYPGAVSTDIVKNLPTSMKWAIKGFSPILKMLMVTPEYCAERMVVGLGEARERAKAGGKHWANIDDKGREVPNKTVFDEEMRKKVREFTWETVDKAGSSA